MVLDSMAMAAASRASTMAAWGIRNCNMCQMTAHAVSIHQSVGATNGRGFIDVPSPFSVLVSPAFSSSSSSSSRSSSSTSAHARPVSAAGCLPRFSTVGSSWPRSVVDRCGPRLSARCRVEGVIFSCKSGNRIRQDLLHRTAMEAKTSSNMAMSMGSPTAHHRRELAPGSALNQACFGSMAPRSSPNGYAVVDVAKGRSVIRCFAEDRNLSKPRWSTAVASNNKEDDPVHKWGIFGRRGALYTHATSSLGVLESQGFTTSGGEIEAGPIAAPSKIGLVTDFDLAIEELDVKMAEGVGREGSMDSGAILGSMESSLGGPLGTGPQAPPPAPLIIVISGPSGVGKDSVIKRLQEARKELQFIVTATTRPMRPGEVDGVDYFFVSKPEFQRMIDGDELLEYAIVYDDYKGIPKEQVQSCICQGKDVVLRVDVQGAGTIRSIVGDGAVFIFLVAESEAALVNRLIRRKTESVPKMLVRVKKAREEAMRMSEFDYVVVNAEAQLQKTVDQICAIIDAEKARVRPRTVKL